MKVYVFRILIISLLTALQACVGVQTFPVASRAGDTVTLALGSQDNIKKSNVTLLYYPQGVATPVDLTANIRSIFKLYPDKTSRAWVLDAGSLTNYSGHSPWQNVLAVDLPVSLPQGPGYFDVILGASVIEPNIFFVKSISGIQIAMDVLPPAANPVANDFGYFASAFESLPTSANLRRLRPLQRVVLRPGIASTYGNTMAAAAQYKIKLPLDAASVSTLDAGNADIRVIWDELPRDGARQIQLSWSRVSDMLTVNVVSPVGGISVSKARFEIVILDVNGVNLLAATPLPQLNSALYFDITGTSVVGPTPEVVFMDLL